MSGLLAGAMAGGSILQGLTSIYNTNKTIQANRKMAEYAYSKDLEMWNKQNQYNDPSQQMARLKNAGLNPNMAYGSGSVAGNTSGQIPKYQAPEQKYDYELPDIGQMVGTYQNVQQTKVQTDLLKEQTNVARQNALNAAVNNVILQNKAKIGATGVEVAQLDLLQKQTLYPYQADQAKLKLAIGNQDLANKKAQNDLFVQGLEKGKKEMYGIDLRNKEQEYKNKLMEQGVQTNDNLIFRQLALFGAGMGWSVDKVVQWWKENMIPTQWKD